MKYFSFGSRDFIYHGHYVWCWVDFLLKKADLFYSYTGIPLIWLRLLCWHGFYFSLILVQNHPGVMPHEIVEKKITLMIE